MNVNNIQFRISAVDQFSKNMNRFSQGMKAMTATTQHMSADMKGAYGKVKETMDVFKKQQMDVQHQFFKLGQSSDEYAGKTNNLMARIKELGKQHKTASDEMLKANTILKGELYQTAGAMLNLSTQAEKISANYSRMANPIYMVNKAGLAAADGLNKMANAGNAAVLAVKMLGPTASMKDLVDMQRMITQGYTRMTMVAIGALVSSVVMYKSLHKAAMESVKGYSESFNRMKASVRQAFEPMVQVFGMVMTKVYNVVNAVAQLAIKFNEAHPLLAKMIQGVMMLIPALTLLLSPLAIGIGLVNGFRAALAFVWPLIGPVVTGLAAMSSTVLIVAAALVGLTTGFVLAYRHIDWFRIAVDTAWAWIKNAFNTALSFIKGIVVSVMSEVSSFFGDQLSKITSLWDSNGSTIMEYVRFYLALVQTHIAVVMGAIKTIFQTAWPIIVGVVKIAWATIQSVISTAVNLITGLMRVGMALLNGDWSAAWTAIKSTATTIVDNIVGYFKGIDLFQVGKDIINGLLNGIESMIGNVSKKVAKVAALIPSGVKKFLQIKSPSRVMMELGAFTSDGLAVGMMNGIQNVMSAASGLASAAVPATSGASLQYGLAPRDYVTGSSNTTTTPAQTQRVSVEIPLYIDGYEVARASVNDLSTLLADQMNTRMRMMGVR